MKRKCKYLKETCLVFFNTDLHKYIYSRKKIYGSEVYLVYGKEKCQIGGCDLYLYVQALKNF